MSTAMVISLGAVAMSLFAVFLALRGARNKARSADDGSSVYGGTDSSADCGASDGGGCDGGGGGD